MFKFNNSLSFLLLCWCGVAGAQSVEGPRKTESFDKNWLFTKGDAGGAEKPAFNDAAWRKLDVPHDWSIEGPFDHNNPTGRGGAYLPDGIGWYRKHFTLAPADAGKEVLLAFDGVMANSDVWVNGYHLGKRPYGYSSFVYDLTGHVNFNKPNVVAVKADNSIQPASRYYTGAGIYRHVRLLITDPVHVDNWGVFITTPDVSAEKATVKVRTTIVNNGSATKTVTVKTKLFNPRGQDVATSKTELVAHEIAAGKSLTVEEDYTVAHPQLWDLDNPSLYKANTEVLENGKPVDNKVTSFGIRSAEFDAATGFSLNGKNVKIKGVCLHHDGGAVGAAVPLSVWERRLSLLKNIGVNGIRTSHNPVAPEFLDLCDRMGFVVMDENLDTWEAKKQHAENGYGQYFKEWGLIDTRDMVLRDRNHPSIVIYSVGNEIHDSLNDSAGFKKYRDLQNIVHEYDGSRPVTMALFRPALSKVYVNGFAAKMDVVGQNYRENELVAAHNAHPDWKVIGTENGHTREAWLALRDHAFMAGQFLWTGFDYLGEADWPDVVNGQGLFDRTGGTRPLTEQRESWWSAKPVVHIVRKQENAGVGAVVADWTPADFDTYDDARVSVYSNCDEVELFLNGKSMGSKPKPADDSPRDWSVTYEKGTIKAVGRNSGKEVAVEELKTAGEPAAIKLTVERPSIKDDWNDVAYVTATVVDDQGVPCPQADKIITFRVSGAGKLVATGNADLANQEIFSSPVRHSYHGKCIAIVRADAASGKIAIKAVSPGLKDGSAELSVLK